MNSAGPGAVHNFVYQTWARKRATRSGLTRTVTSGLQWFLRDTPHAGTFVTVASPEEPHGTELQLALNDDPAARTYQQAMFQQGKPAGMFYTDDVQADHERIEARGGEFTMPPTQVTGSTIAMVNDTCGNLIQLTQLSWQG